MPISREKREAEIPWSAISLPATMSLMYKVLPGSKRTMGVTMHVLVKPIPMALGPLLGGIFIGRDVPLEGADRRII